jgi:short-subunit dehydrogenase
VRYARPLPLGPATRALVTGSSSGIGRALAEALAARQVRLVLTGRRVDQLEAVAERAAAVGAPRPIVITADLAFPGQARRLADRALESLGGLDLLVNNAGGGAAGTVWRAADGAAARDAFEINYWSPLALAAAVVPRMLEQGRGTVVNVTSLGQVMTWPMMGPYTATKAALGSATETLRLELQRSPVGVIEVIPGPVATAVQAESALLPGFAAATRTAPLGDPGTLARRIVRAIERGRGRVVYPARLRPAYALPGVTRAAVGHLARRGASEAARADDRVLRSGSHGDDAARQARRGWESINCS